MNKEKLVRKLIGEKKMEAMVQRLDRLTQNEARQTVAQILKVVHGLVENVKVVIKGEQNTPSLSPAGCRRSFPIDGEVSIGNLKEALGTFF
jgi:hypothetical protein